jgi:hypothetical protein
MLTSSARTVLDLAGHIELAGISSGELASKDNERCQVAVLILKSRNPRHAAGLDATGRKNLSGFSAYS